MTLKIHAPHAINPIWYTSASLRRFSDMDDTISGFWRIILIISQMLFFLSPFSFWSDLWTSIHCSQRCWLLSFVLYCLQPFKEKFNIHIWWGGLNIPSCMHSLNTILWASVVCRAVSRFSFLIFLDRLSPMNSISLLTWIVMTEVLIIQPCSFSKISNWNSLIIFNILFFYFIKPIKLFYDLLWSFYSLSL